jgi:hypothetical protein
MPRISDPGFAPSHGRQRMASRTHPECLQLEMRGSHRLYAQEDQSRGLIVAYVGHLSSNMSRSCKRTTVYCLGLMGASRQEENL